MQDEMVSVCPVCGGSLRVVELRCPGCGTGLSGQFELPRLLSLERSQMEFVETFLRCRGNIKEVERELGVSYPTVRNRLEDVIQTLGFKSQSGPSPADVLDSLSRGELSVDEAVVLLKRR